MCVCVCLSLSLSHHLHHHREDPKPQHSLSKKKKTQHKNSSQTPSKPTATPISPLQQLLDSHSPSLQAAAVATIAIPYFYRRRLYSSQTHLFSPTLPHHHIHRNPIPNKPSKHWNPPSNPSEQIPQPIEKNHYHHT